jgi:hypothetical protein
MFDMLSENEIRALYNELASEMQDMINGWRAYVVKAENRDDDELGRHSGYLAGLRICADQAQSALDASLATGKELADA